MRALIVLSHPGETSLSHTVAALVGEGIARSGSGNTFEVVDLNAEDFDPRFSSADLAAHRGLAPRPSDIIAEQARIDDADALVLVFPVYWWSMPGLLKGWFDRVFSHGWAYDDSGPKVIKKLRHLPIHLVGIGGADTGTYERHGYLGAMKTQIDHGIFDYCGAPVVTSQLLLESDGPDQSANLEAALAIGAKLFSQTNQGSADAAE